MDLLGAIAAIVSVITGGYLMYTRWLRKRHKIDFNVGNVSLVRVVSPDPMRNEKLALVTYGLTFVNLGPDPVTLKEVVLQYRFGRRKETNLAAVPTGSVNGQPSVVMAIGADRIVMAWSNLRDELSRKQVIQTGEITDGSGIFFLDAPVDRYREVSGYVLVVRDHSGGESRHPLIDGPEWYNGMAKGAVLVDAPARENLGVISWTGITIGQIPAEEGP